jgi:DNA processing protein
MDLQKEFFACLALRHTPRLGPKLWKVLFAHYPSAYEIVHSTSGWPAVDPEHERSLRGVAKSCAAEKWRPKAEAEYRDAIKAGMEVVTWFDPRFPESLKNIEDPPCMLYVSGDVSLLKNPGVAVVGARECTALGLNSAGRISAQLSRIGITVISGLALGIDRQAHLGGLSGIGSSIAVLGCGLDIVYPTDNVDVRRALDAKGLVVTEFGPGVSPRPGNFPFRNRIISALSLGVLVAEAAHNSGSLITARLAGEHGREVFALPGPLGQPTFTGCHKLIKQGASLVESAEDIVEILRFDFARELAAIPDPEPFDERDDPLVVLAEMNLSGLAGETAVVQPKPVAETASADASATDAGTEKNQVVARKRPSAVERKGLVLDADERALMDVLLAGEKLHIDALGRALGWESSRVSQVLLMLEMRGAVHQLPGMWYFAKEPENDA